MRSLRDLTQHLTTRADDSHAAPVTDPAELKEIISNDMWDHWINLRAYIMYSSLIQMEGLNINEVNFPSKWEYEKGKNITESEIKKGLEFIKKSSPKIDTLFKYYDFLALPSAQIFPFDKNISYPKTIEDHPLDTYHRWMEVTILASIFQLPSISIPIGFNDRAYRWECRLLLLKEMT